MLHGLPPGRKLRCARWNTRTSTPEPKLRLCIEHSKAACKETAQRTSLPTPKITANFHRCASMPKHDPRRGKTPAADCAVKNPMGKQNSTVLEMSKGAPALQPTPASDDKAHSAIASAARPPMTSPRVTAGAVMRRVTLWRPAGSATATSP